MTKRFIETISTGIVTDTITEKEYKKMVEKIANRKAKLSRGGTI